MGGDEVYIMHQDQLLSCLPKSRPHKKKLGRDCV